MSTPTPAHRARPSYTICSPLVTPSLLCRPISDRLPRPAILSRAPKRYRCAIPAHLASAYPLHPVPSSASPTARPCLTSRDWLCNCNPHVPPVHRTFAPPRTRTSSRPPRALCARPRIRPSRRRCTLRCAPQSSDQRRFLCRPSTISGRLPAVRVGPCSNPH